MFTIGHSNHPLDRFVHLLGSFDIDVVVDVRKVPQSRKWPHFRSAELARSLPLHGIDYTHMAALGGWRRPRVASPNRGWRNVSFRGYADYMVTDVFREALGELAALADTRRIAVMCSEALWWRCHRRLISDRLVTAGRNVLHIGSDARLEVHRLPAFAIVQADGSIVYPGPSEL